MNACRFWALGSALAVVLAGFASAACAGQTFSVDRFGARPNDGKDDTAAFLSAFHACTKAPGSTLSLVPGQYDLAMRTTPPDGSAPPLLVVKNAKGLTIDGHGAELVCHDYATLFWFENCRDVVIRNLKIDYDPLPFTAGQIIAEGGDIKGGTGYLDIKIEPHHPLQAGFRAESLLQWDPVRHRMGPMRDDLYQPGLDRRTEQVAPGVLRVPNSRKLLKIGDWVILRHQIYSKNAFNFDGCEKVTLDDVTVYTCPGMALHASNGEDFTLRKFNVMLKPGTGRWFTATADATHFNGTRGKVLLEDCLLEAMGDDGANIHNFFLIVSDVVDARTFKCYLGKDKNWEVPVPRAGDVLEIGRKPNSLLPFATPKVASAKTEEGGKVAVITLQETPAQPIQPGDVVGDASTLPAAEVRHCTIRSNRARGVLIQTRNSVVENCDFQDISGAAIQVTCDANWWWEGMPARNVTIRDNTITRVNFSEAARDAAIDIFAEVGRAPAPQPVHKQIDIEHNTISNVNGSAIHVGSAEQVTIRGNTFVSPTAAAIHVDHSRDVDISGNKLTGNVKEVNVGAGVEAGTVKVH